MSADNVEVAGDLPSDCGDTCNEVRVGWKLLVEVDMAREALFSVEMLVSLNTFFLRIISCN